MDSGAIILAAGSSSRMGRSKQMLEIRGERLLVQIVQTVLKAGISNVTVVLGANEQAHRSIIQHLPVDIVFNKNWERGMGSSLKCGLQHLVSRHPKPGAVVIFVCDQPLLEEKNISALLQKYKETGKPIVASRYLKQPGVPVLFDRKYFPELAGLPDDAGAKKIVLQNPADVAEVDFPGGEVDLDTMKDYEAFRNLEL